MIWRRSLQTMEVHAVRIDDGILSEAFGPLRPGKVHRVRGDRSYARRLWGNRMRRPVGSSPARSAMACSSGAFILKTASSPTWGQAEGGSKAQACRRGAVNSHKPDFIANWRFEAALHADANASQRQGETRDGILIAKTKKGLGRCQLRPLSLCSATRPSSRKPCRL